MTHKHICHNQCSPRRRTLHRYTFFIRFLVVLLYCASLNTYACADESTPLPLNLNDWNYIRQKKEQGTFKQKPLPKISIQPQTKAQQAIAATPPEQGITFELPYQSKLNIAGRKNIGITYGFSQYISGTPGTTAAVPTTVKQGFDMKQELQVRINGTVGRKIHVNVDYDDTVKEKRDILVSYQGTKKGEVIDEKGTVAERDEIMQEIVFGDINLSLPSSTEFIGYNKNLFGIRVKAKYDFDSSDFTLAEFRAIKKNPVTLLQKIRPHQAQVPSERDAVDTLNFMLADKELFAYPALVSVIKKKPTAREHIERAMASKHRWQIKYHNRQLLKILFSSDMPGDPPPQRNGGMNLTFIGSQTKGITETKRFIGNTTFEKRDIADTAYIAHRYYRLYGPNTQWPPYPIKQDFANGNIADVVIYLDDRGDDKSVYAQDKSTKTVYNIYDTPVSTYTSTGFYKLTPGVHYTLDLVNGIVTFKKEIKQNYVIGFDYKVKGGDFTGTYLMVKYDETTGSTTARKQEVRTYYSLGNTNITTDKLDKNFVLKILDKNRAEQSVTLVGVIDRTTGILKFDPDIPPFDTPRNTPPFDPLYPDLYKTINPESKYIIYVEYYYRIRTFMIRPNLVLDSENIVVDGVRLQKNIDYIIDYDIGFLTFLDDQRIGPNSMVEITYEYMPFGGQYQQTLAGGRLEYQFPKKRGVVGATMIYSAASEGTTTPSIRSTPNSIKVYDSDLSLGFAPRIFRTKDSSFSLSGEVAASQENPNVSGKAIVENMENALSEDVAPTDRELWHVASNPNRLSSVLTNWGAVTDGKYLGNNNVKAGDIDKNIPDDTDKAREVQVLAIPYTLTPTAPQLSFVYPVHKEGLDYSKKDHMEVWLYTDAAMVAQNQTIRIHYGTVNEDADGKGGFPSDVINPDTGRVAWAKGQPKTEDVDASGYLESGKNEDIGWNYVGYGVDASTVVYPMGAQNGKIDTEDLDSDNFLSKDEKGYVYSIACGTAISAGWNKFVVPVDSFTPTGTDPSWYGIKQVRITIEAPPSVTKSTGTLQVYGLKMVGNKWDKAYAVAPSTMTVSAVSRINDFDYRAIIQALIDDKTLDFRNLYPDNNTTSPYGSTTRNEQALKLAYNLTGATTAAYTRCLYTKEMDLSKHKNLKFFLWGRGQAGEVYVRLGSDDGNYYEYISSQTASTWPEKWIEPVISLEDNNKDGKIDGFNSHVGEPSIKNIRYIVIGVRNPGISSITGEILINDFFVSDPIVIDGIAWKSGFSFEHPGWMSVRGNYRYVEPTFQTISATAQEGVVGAQSITSGQKQKSYAGAVGIQRVSWLPVTVDYAHNETEAEAIQGTNISILNQGRTETDSRGVKTEIKIGGFPSISGAYSKSKMENYSKKYSTQTFDNTDNRLLNRTETHEGYSGGLSYTFPFGKAFLAEFLPNNIGAGYSYQKADYDYGQSSGTTPTRFGINVEEHTYGYSMKTDFSFFDRVGLTPSYNLGVVKSRYDTDSANQHWYLRSRKQDADATMNITILSWLKPSVSYKSNITETYSLGISTTSSEIVIVSTGTKDILRSNSGNAQVGVEMINVLKTAHMLLPIFDPQKHTRPLSRMRIGASYTLEDADSWEKLDKDYETLDKIFIRDLRSLDVKYMSPLTGRRLSMSNKDSIKCTFEQLYPLDFDIGDWFLPFRTLKTTLIYTEEDIRKDETGTQSGTFTKVWPEIRGNMGKLERLLLLEKYMTDTDFTWSYFEKTIVTKNVSQKFDTYYDGTYKFKLFNFYDFSIDGKYEAVREYVLQYGKDTTSGYAASWGVQTGMQWPRVSPNTTATTPPSWTIRVTPRYGEGYAQDRDYILNAITKETTHREGSITTRLDKLLPAKWRIPFTNKRVSLSNSTRLIVDSELKATFDDSKVAADKKNAYSLSMKTQYKVSKNVDMGMSGSASKVDYLDTQFSKNSYMFFEIGASVAIMF